MNHGEPKVNAAVSRIEVPEGEAKAFLPSPYVQDRGRICLRRDTESGPVLTPLCNFTASIVGELVRDDGAEKQTYFNLEGRLASGGRLERIEVPSAQFSGLGWILIHWGARAVVNAGNGTKDHLRAALQTVSGAPPRRVVFAHVGWRQIEDRWLYLHAGGAIGVEGSVQGVEVDPGGKLQGFTFPDPPKGEALREAIRASLGLLSVAPDEVTVPLFLACYRAAMGPSPFAIHLAGQTGTGKSVLQGLVQAHWGAGFDHQSIPGNWQSTKTALEVLTFAAKDAVLCVDDFAPDGTRQDQARLQGTMSHIFRSVGNGSSRDRCTDAANLRPSRPPRSLVISSGEDLPAGHSIRARVMILETQPHMTRWERVTELQSHASSGRLAAAMAGYVQWLAPQISAIPGALSLRLQSLRGAFQATHKRTTDQAVQLFAAGEYFLRFAMDSGALNPSEVDAFQVRFRKALGEVAEAQAEAQANSDPVRRFLELLRALFQSGRAHLEGTMAQEPEHSERLGWSQEPGAPQTLRRPKGYCIGWEDANDGLIYLEPGACFAGLQALASMEGELLPVSKQTLWKRLRERGLIEVEGAGRLNKKVPGRGQWRRAIALKSFALWPYDEASPNQEPKGPGHDQSPGGIGEVA